MSEHINTRRKLRAITEISTFNDLLSKILLPPKYKELLEMYYIKDMTFLEIGEVLGIEEITAKTWHRKALNKISKML